MNELELVLPTLAHKQQVEDYKQKFLADMETMGPNMAGVGRLKVLDFEEWLQECHDHMEGKNLPEGFVPATTFLGIRKADGNLVGSIQIRHRLTPHLLEIGGHIGYGVVPDERGKGYATQMLKIAIDECKKFGIDKVRVTCLEHNIASETVIRNCGGEYDGTANDGDKVLKRFWVVN